MFSPIGVGHIFGFVINVPEGKFLDFNYKNVISFGKFINKSKNVPNNLNFYSDMYIKSNQLRSLYGYLDFTQIEVQFC